MGLCGQCAAAVGTVYVADGIFGQAGEDGVGTVSADILRRVPDGADLPVRTGRDSCRHVS